jgi:hypothetical protein
MSDDTKFKLLSVFNKLGRRIRLSTFNERLVFQKQVYLLQEFGLNFSNDYGWYKRGPYSRDAANDGFQIVSIQDNIDYFPELSEEEVRSVNKFKNLVSDSQRVFRDKNLAYIMELVGSLHFIIKYGYPRPTDKKNALTVLSDLKPIFREDAESALKLLEKYELI